MSDKTLSEQFAEVAKNASAIPWRVGDKSHNLVSDTRTVHSAPHRLLDGSGTPMSERRMQTQDETDAENIAYYGAVGLVAESVVPGAAAFMAWCSQHVEEIGRGLELLALLEAANQRG